MSADAAERGFNSPRTNRLTGMTVARGVLIVDVADETVELSPTDWAQAQTSKILETGTTEGIDVLGSPIVLLTLRGAKTGKLRYTPVMRVEHDGRYAVVASKGGAPEHPTWYHNIKAYPEFPLQDGTVTKDYVAREVAGAERGRVVGAGRGGIPALRRVPEEDRQTDPGVRARLEVTGRADSTPTMSSPPMSSLAPDADRPVLPRSVHLGRSKTSCTGSKT
jgi:deazaflavin-dependent oxidoreductase (nitroreductase family)